MEVVNEDLLKDAKEIFMIGIGGVGMSALARVLSHQGYSVSGSDAKESKTTRALIKEGVSVCVGEKEHVFGAEDLVIYSSAIKTDHFELAAAKASGAKVYHRAEILASLLNGAKTSVAITGTHGKTTTASMISYILSEMKREPTCLVGGEVLNFATNTVLGNRDLWISEVDESDQSHELFSPSYTIVTNLERDHVDRYASEEAVLNSFKHFFSNLNDPGALIYNADDKVLSDLVFESRRPSVSFGFSENCDYSAQNIKSEAWGVSFELFESGFFSKEVKLGVPGKHNVYNALATIALLMQLGQDLEVVVEHLESFQGTKRRLQVIYQSDDVMIVDDYAHHPTEVKASIEALQSLGKKVVVVFEPHRYSRANHFAQEFATALLAADEIILTDIYSAGELNAEGISSEVILNKMKEQNLSHEVNIISKEKLIPFLLSQPKKETVLAFLGAGDISEVAHEFLGSLKNAASS